jgi:hypothetical protein
VDNPGSGGPGPPDAKAREVWEAALAALQARVSRQSFATWFHTCEKVRRRLAADEAFRRQVEALSHAIAS